MAVWAEFTGLPRRNFIEWVGIHRSRFYDWKIRYGLVNEHWA